LTLANETDELGPQIALVVGTTASAGETMGLTGKSSTENIDGCEAALTGLIRKDFRLPHMPAAESVDFSDILVAPHVGPVRGEHGATEWIDLHLPLDLVACTFKAEVEAADAGEQAPDRHRV